MARQARREARQGAFRLGPLLQAIRGRRASWSLHEALAKARERASPSPAWHAAGSERQAGGHGLGGEPRPCTGPVRPVRF